MKSTEAWEIRGLKIFCVLSAICAAMNLLMRLPELNIVPALVALLWVVSSTVWLAGAVFVIWSHNGFVTIEGAKMSKSLGNVRLVRELLEDVPGEAIRFALLSAHYRSSIDLSDRSLRDARHGLDRLYGAMRELSNIEPSDEGGGLVIMRSARSRSQQLYIATKMPFRS